MMRSLYSAVSGLKSHQIKMDVVGNNIANVNTAGFKKSNVNFQDALSQAFKAASAPSAENGGVNPGDIGTGVTVGSINLVHTQGAVSTTGNATDVMIQGDGFFILGKGDSSPYIMNYSRSGVFGFDVNGALVNLSNGLYVLDDSDTPAKITVPDINTVSSISIAQNGDVVYVDSSGNSQTAGAIGLAKFANNPGLLKAGESLFAESVNSGTAAYGTPSEDGRGTLISGSLEMSNVDLSEEFTDMIVTQRGFQANARTITVSDELLQELINLKR